jgi:hypothetical protein
MMRLSPSQMSDLQALVRSTIESADCGAVAGDIDIKEALDSSGDEAIFVHAAISNASGQTGAKFVLDITSRLRNLLQQTGDDRYPYVFFNYQKVAA